MEQFIFGQRNGVRPRTNRADATSRHGGGLDVAAGGGRVLFVVPGSNNSCQVSVSLRQYYVNHRWLGGMLTNWKTISNSIKRLRVLEDQLAEEDIGLTKRELLKVERERAKLDQSLGGIKEMGGLPDILFIIDTNKEDIAVKEATKLGLPVIGVIDSNSSPEGITYPIPGNDDAMRAIDLYCGLISGAVLDGLQAELVASGSDAGEQEEPPAQIVPEGPAEQVEAASEPAPEAAETVATSEETPAEETAKPTSA